MSISSTALSVSLLHHHVRSGRSFTFFPCRAPPTFSSSESKFLCLATSSVSSSGENEESRWLREEQRWLREEQRWLREELRWNSERESLFREISTLRLTLQQLESELERRDSLPQTAANLPTPISLPSTQSDPPALPPPIPSSSSSLPIESTTKEIKEVNKDNDLNKQAKATNPNRKALRIGSEGEEVREMQEALLKLGFYSGEEEMEFFSFSTGTQRAVKTWQATFGAPEDGIMTEELLNRLYMGTANGAPFISVTKNTVEMASHRAGNWEKPLQNWVSLTTNGAFKLGTKTIGAGGVLRNSEGGLIRCFARREAGTSAAQAELLGRVSGWRRRRDSAGCRCDALNVVKLIVVLCRRNYALPLTYGTSSDY